MKYFSSSHSVIPGGRLEIVPGRDQIRLEGCGCFLLFQRESKGGQAYLLDQLGTHYYNLHTIGSIYKQVRLKHMLTLCNIVLKDCGRIVEYRAAKGMMIGTSTVILVVVVGSLIYRRYTKLRRRNRQTSETPPERRPSSSSSRLELDILNSDRILAETEVDDDFPTGRHLEDGPRS